MNPILMTNLPSLRYFPFPGIENAYTVISISEDETKSNKMRSTISFVLYINETRAVELEPENGALTIYDKCEEDWKPTDEYDIELGLKPIHSYIFPYVTGHHQWGQLIVNDKECEKLLSQGRYEEFFNIMKEFGEKKQWAT